MAPGSSKTGVPQEFATYLPIIAHIVQKVNSFIALWSRFVLLDHLYANLLYFDALFTEQLSERLGEIFGNFHSERQLEGAFTVFIFENHDNILDARVELAEVADFAKEVNI